LVKAPAAGAAIIAALVCAVVTGPVASNARETAPVNPAAILARVKASLRARERPPYVVYTLVRRDALNRIPDPLNSYTLRIWCRTADNAALSRRTFGSRAVGAAAFITPAFDEPVDPGPPTADLLDVIHQATPQPSATLAGTDTAPRVIGSVAVVIESAYHVTYAGTDGDDVHLGLEARRDPDRNRLTDLYVDRATDEIHRAVAHDHLYTEGRSIPERFEIEFGTSSGVRVITAIHGQTDYAALGVDDAGEPLHEVDYRFEDIAFPLDLPTWYFDPAQYGAHRDDYPM
jgi:hypothetical protein